MGGANQLPRLCHDAVSTIAGKYGNSRDRWRRRRTRAKGMQPYWNTPMFEEYVRQIAEFVRANEAWAAPIIFALAFGESLAFISLLLPAWAALVTIGTIVGATGINFLPILVAGAVGAALGDWLSYWIGLKLENRVYHMWPFTRHPGLIPKGEAFVKKWGVLAIVIGDRKSVV